MRLRSSQMGGCVVGVMLALNVSFSFAEEIRYQSGDKRDPFAPINRKFVTNAEEAGIKVEGILYDASGKSMIVINGETYKVGDSVDGQQILAIYPSRVLTLLKGKEVEYWISAAEQELAQGKKNEGR